MPAPVVLIIGALIGIGRAAAVSVAKGGSRVVVDRSEEKGHALELCACGAKAAFVNNAGAEGQPGPLTESQSRLPLPVSRLFVAEANLLLGN